jgi:hypothetical protein
MSAEHEVKSVGDVFQLAAKGVIRKLEGAPITVDLRLTGGTITVEVPPKHSWFKELHRNRVEQVKRLRASLKADLTQ